MGRKPHTNTKEQTINLVPEYNYYVFPDGIERAKIYTSQILVRLKYCLFVWDNDISAIRGW